MKRILLILALSVTAYAQGPTTYPGIRTDSCVGSVATPNVTPTALAWSAGVATVTTTMNPGVNKSVFLTGNTGPAVSWNIGWILTTASTTSNFTFAWVPPLANLPASGIGTAGFCNIAAPTGTFGAPLVYQAGPSDPVPFNRLDLDTNPAFCPSFYPPIGGYHTDCAVAGMPFTDPDFGTYSVFATDQNTGVSTTIYSAGSEGGYDEFGLGYPNDVMFTYVSTGGIKFLAHILEANLLARTCLINPCVVKSNILGAGCTPTPGVYTGTGICTQQQIVNGGGSFSRNPNDTPNTVYEAAIPVITKTIIATGNTTLTGGPANDSVTRATYVNFSTDSGGAVPCSVLPPNYKVTWTGTFNVADGGGITVALGGGGPYADFVQAGSTVLTPDVFILPVGVKNTPWTITGYTVSGTGPYTIVFNSVNTLTASGGHVVAVGVKPVAAQGIYTVSSFTGATITVSSATNPGAYVSTGTFGYGNAMFQASAGTTAGSVSEPNWINSCQAQGDVCSGDGTVSWTNIGPVAGQGPGFEIVHFDSHGCSRRNTRLAKIYRGTNQGVNWPSAGTPDASGQVMTDDAATCFRMGGTNCGTGGIVALTDKYVIHEVGQKFDSRYSDISPTGAGSVNNNYAGGNSNVLGGGWPEISPTPTGSCNTTISYTSFLPAWPNSVWVSGQPYPFNKYTYSPSDHNIYKSFTHNYDTANSTIDPASDLGNWQFRGYHCYLLITDWYTNIERPIQDYGPDFGGDGHQAYTYGFEYMGGVYWSHYFNLPNCPTTVSVYCNGSIWPTNNYVSAPYPGTRVLTISLPADGHTTTRNGGPGDLQPIFDATTTGGPVWGGVGTPMKVGGGSGFGGYTGPGYNEEISFPTDGSQIVNRYGHNYNTGSNFGFGTRWGIGVISRDGKMMSYSSDFNNSRGDRTAVSQATCVSPLRSQYLPKANQLVTYLDNMQPEGNNNGIDQYQAVGFYSGVFPTGSYVASGTGNEGATIPNWNTVCPSAGNYCTTDGTNNPATGQPLDGNVLWKNLGANSCRGDIAVMAVGSQVVSLPNTAPIITMFAKARKP